MYFDAKLIVTINNIQILTIVSAKISNDSQKVGSSADIVLPLNSYISYQDTNTLEEYLTAIRTDTFSSGDPVVITAYYVNYPQVELFRGYVYDTVLGMPLTIKCLDYIYFFNLGIFGSNHVATTNKAGTKIKSSGTGIHYKSIQFKDLLQQLVAFANQTIANLDTDTLPVELILPTIDMPLFDLTFINMSPAAILEYFKKNLGLNITFYGNKLWVNIASETNGLVKLDTSRNVLDSKLQTTLSIKSRTSKTSKSVYSAFERIRLKCWFVSANGTRSSIEVGDPDGIQEEQFFYKVSNVGNVYDTLANAALLSAQQHHYRGELELLLYPTCDLFYVVDYVDVRYPAKSGEYYITSIHIELGEKGFHRKIKVAFLNLPTYTYLKGQTVITSGPIQGGG